MRVFGWIIIAFAAFLLVRSMAFAAGPGGFADHSSCETPATALLELKKCAPVFDDVLCQVCLSGIKACARTKMWGHADCPPVAVSGDEYCVNTQQCDPHILRKMGVVAHLSE